MDRLPTCIDELCVLAKSSDADPFVVVEMRGNEFVRAEGGGRAPLGRLLQAIEAQEDTNLQGEDWTIAKEYVHSLRERLEDGDRNAAPIAYWGAARIGANKSTQSRGLIERKIEDYHSAEPGNERPSLERLRDAIDCEEAEKRKGEDCSIAKHFVRSWLSWLA
jgi:hypothetical protein